MKNISRVKKNHCIIKFYKNFLIFFVNKYYVFSFRVTQIDRWIEIWMNGRLFGRSRVSDSLIQILINSLYDFYQHI